MSVWSLFSTSWLRSQRYVRPRLAAPSGGRRHHWQSTKTPVRLTWFEELEDRNLLSASLGYDDDILVEFQGEDLAGKDGAMASLGLDLLSLYHEYLTFSLEGTGEVFLSSNSLFQIDPTGERVLVDIAFDTDASLMVDDLTALGMEVTGTWGRIASGFLPIDAIGDLAVIGGVRSAAGTAAYTSVGSVTSQGDIAQNSDLARANFGVDGTGVTVGVLSDSFNSLGGYGSDITTGDLPNDVTILADISGGSDEGRAMAQLVYDVVPGADLAFHTAFAGMANFANGIVDLATIAGADVIVDDVIYFAEPMFQDGIIAQAVDTVVDMGVSYFSSAGNSARSSYESEFRNSGIDLGPMGTGDIPLQFFAHDFDPGAGVDLFQTVTFPFYGAPLALQWDDPFFSVSGGAGAATDIDIAIFDMDGNFLTGSFDANIGSDPVEILAEFGQVQIAIGKFAGPDPNFIKYVVFDDAFVMNEYNTASGTSYGHANAAGAEAVGAAFYAETPAYGVNPPSLEGFSSAGEVPILFDTDGNRLATPEIRNTPDIVAPDGSNTTFFGSDVEGDGFPNFFGTSAAAPHAAGVAALLLEASGGPGFLTPAEQYSILETTAIDMDDPSTVGFDVGYDFATGFGLIDANAAVEAALAPVPPVADADGPYVLGERDMVQLDGSGSFDRNQPADTLVYLWDYHDDGIYDAMGVRPYFTTADLDGKSSAVVRLKVIDSDGLFSTDLTRVFAEDSAQLDITGDTDGVVGQKRVIELNLVGQSVTNEDYTYIVDWGDGSAPRTYVGRAGLPVSKVYNRTGNFTIHVTALNEDTGLYTEDTHRIRIETMQMQGDNFAVSGTNGADDFKVISQFGLDRVSVVLNDVNLGTFTVRGSVFAFGLNGDDTFRSDDGTYNVMFDGGRGNNTSYTYGGNDTIYGRDGDDRIYDDGGNNYINAGDGDNVIQTGVGNDVIMSGNGNDRITDTGGDNEIFAGNGDNDINTRRGNDLIITGFGHDQVNDIGGNNWIEVGDGSNVVHGGDGSDTILGGNQDDHIYTAADIAGGYNFIATFGGNDFIYAGGLNLIDSGPGDDFIFASNILDDEDDLFDLLARWR